MPRSTPHSEETKRKISAAHKGRTISPEQRARISATLKGRKATQKQLDALASGRGPRTEATKQKHSLNRAKQGSAGCSRVELSLVEPLAKLGYEHTGLGGFYVTGSDKRTRIPDFVNRERRQIVEIWGTYWHRGEDPQDLIDWYAAVGWECKVYWETEVGDLL